MTATKPGSCTKPLPGIFADIVDEEGRPVKTPDAGGYLVIKRPWPSMLRTIWGDNDRYITTYWEKFKNRYYVAGDSARRDKDGYYWIMGRIDDVLNIAGHQAGHHGNRVGAGRASQGGGGRGGQQTARHQGRIGVCLRGAQCAEAARRRRESP